MIQVTKTTIEIACDCGGCAKLAEITVSGLEGGAVNLCADCAEELYEALVKGRRNGKTK